MSEENKKPKIAVLTCGDSNALLIAEKIKELGYEVVNVVEPVKEPIDDLVAKLNDYVDNCSIPNIQDNHCWWQKFEKKKNRKHRY